jgi:hypothetical protein
MDQHPSGSGNNPNAPPDNTTQKPAAAYICRNLYRNLYGNWYTWPNEERGGPWPNDTATGPDETTSRDLDTDLDTWPNEERGGPWPNDTATGPDETTDHSLAVSFTRSSR